MTGFQGQLNILDEDNHILVVEKPANIPVQGDKSGDPTLLDILKDFIKRRDDKPGNVFLGLVQRLDRPTQGLMVVAKTSKAAGRLSKAMLRGELVREYLAVVRVAGSLRFDQQDESVSWVDWLVKDQSTNIVRIADKNAPRAKRAELEAQVLKQRDDLGLMRFSLKTGRSHQIRVQAASRGLVLWGDQRYGFAVNKPGMQLALFANKLGFAHPVGGRECLYELEAPKTEPWGLFFDK